MKLVEPSTSQKRDPGSQTFDEEYYRCSCGPNPYERNEAWLTFVSSIAEQVIRSLSPNKLLDAGCALGMLVEAFWDRTIQAYGIDLSSYAIADVRPDMREYCRIGSIAEPIEGPYDLVTCIEVLEHMSAADAEAAIRSLTEATGTILFSSSPDDFEELTYVRPPLSWMQLFTQHGLWPDLTYDASFLTPHAILFRRRAEGLSSDVVISYNERLRAKCALARAEQSLKSRDGVIEEVKRNAAAADQSLRSHDATIGQMKRNIEQMNRNATKTFQDRDRAQQALRGAKIELQRLSVIETSTIWRMTSSLRSFAGYFPKSVRLYGRRAARVVGWLLTPHRIPARLRFLKDRQRVAYGATPAYAQREDRKVLISSNSSRKATNAPEQPNPIEGLQRDLIASSSLFDADWYLKEYPEVAALSCFWDRLVPGPWSC